MSILTIIGAALLLGIVVAIHETGHFLAAKLSGIRVNEFSIGMGPRLFGGTRNGTKYTLRLLPVGGYVALEGENSPESTAKGEAFGEAAAGIPFAEAPLLKRCLTVLAGPMMNFVLGFLLLVVMVSVEGTVITSRTVSRIEPGAMCGLTGLAEDDTIVAVNGRHCFTASDILYGLARAENGKADITVRREGKTVQLSDVSFDTETDENGTQHLLIGFRVYGLPKTVPNVLREALMNEVFYGRVIFASLADLAVHRESLNDLSGPVGIVTAIGDAAAAGWEELLDLMILITVNLGVFNLLPFPALDGGKLVFLAAEGITGHSVPESIQGYFNLAGFLLLFALMAFATRQDIIRLLTPAG